MNILKKIKSKFSLLSEEDIKILNSFTGKSIIPSNLYSNIKNFDIAIGDVYCDSNNHHIIIRDIIYYRCIYKSYKIFNSLIKKFFKPKFIIKPLNFTITIETQGKTTITEKNINGKIEKDEIKGIFSISILPIDYDIDFNKQNKLKEFEKYLSVDTKFPKINLIKIIPVKNKK